MEQATAGRFDLLELDLEPACWRIFTGTANTVVTLKPDLLVVTANTTTETHSFVEVDRGTEHLPAVLRKCRIYQRYADTGTEQANRGLFPAVVWIVPDAVRAAKIRAAIAADKALRADLFWTVTPEQALHHLAPYGASTT
ncbi:replication-relaxation family protein [Microbacterium profundi]